MKEYFEKFGVSAMASLLIATYSGRPPEEVLMQDGLVYLRRWHLRKDCTQGNIYLHNVVRNDPDSCCHDHPWDSSSIILTGVLSEDVLNDEGNMVQGSTYRPGDIVNRKAEDAHRLIIEEGPCWTLFMTGPVRRKWGFHTPDGWMPWREFVAGSTRQSVIKDES